jgi:hypothetical protein
MALPLPVARVNEVHSAPIAPGLRLRGLEPLAFWMQTMGASLLAAKGAA